ncbi:MAG TPA: VOC family protein [Streptosporangiaceae bacterium]
MTDWEKEIGAMTLLVPDLDQAKEFYQNAFGLDGRQMDEATIMLRFKSMFVFLHTAASAQEPLPEILNEARNGAGQFAIIVDDVDAVCAEITGRGVQLLSGPADRDWGMRTITFADPGGPNRVSPATTPAEPGACAGRRRRRTGPPCWPAGSAPRCGSARR